MKKIFSLTKVMLKNSNMGVISENKKQAQWKKMLATLGIVSLFVILAVAIYFISNDLLIALQTAGLESLVLQVVLIALSVYLLFTGIISVPIVFYFSKDIEGLLALPLKPFEILSAKAITSYVNMLISASFLFLPFGVAYQLVIKPHFIFSVFYLLVFLIIPIIPLAISIGIIVLLFTLIPKANNKDLFTYASSILMIIIIFAVNFTTGSVTDDLGQIALDNIGLLNQVPKLIPSIGLLILAIKDLNVLALVGALLFSLGIAFVVLWGIQNLYFKGVIGAQVSSTRKKKRRRKNQKEQSQLTSIIKTDLRNILRTPSLAINYFLPLVIMPAFLIFPVIIGLDVDTLKMAHNFLLGGRELINNLDGLTLMPYLIFISFIVTYFSATFSTITSTGISREGETMQIYKSMPVDLMTIVNAKIILGMIVGSIFPVLLIVIISFLLRFNIIAIIIMFVSLITALTFANTSDIISDLIKPKLEWDDEIQAVKQNFISIIPLLASFPILGLFIFAFLKFNPLAGSLIVLTLGAGFSILNYKVIIERYALKKLDEAIQQL